MSADDPQAFRCRLCGLPTNGQRQRRYCSKACQTKSYRIRSILRRSHPQPPVRT